MRLLNCATHALESFLGSNVPAYAILSHTWEEEEVVYDDFVSERTNHTTKRGWYKIQQACDQAVRDGFSYLWADTLCIDKSSSSELSETLNSMFKWYQDSAICYAYLSDLPNTGLADSRWFTRGWTLQEMIAPRSIHFFDKGWTFQGSKKTLLDELHHITGVDRTVLQGGSLRVISVARKMSWASKRQATRPEDMAYSLLGLFDISMPMLYGEGSRAFIRLQEEILKQYDDQSMFAWVSDERWSSWGFFAPSPKHFSQSANIVACHSHMDQDEPITITSRGLRIVAPLHSMEAQERSNGAFMLRLNCKLVDFNMSPEDRIGIILFKGLGRACYRLYTNRHHTYEGNFQKNATIIYGVKESHVDMIEMIHGVEFWVRTFPSWPQRQDYELELGHPIGYWYPKNGIFLEQFDRERDRTFCLVFRRTASKNTGNEAYFLVFLGYKILKDSSCLDGNVWCAVRFCRTSGFRIEDLAREYERTSEHTSSWDTQNQSEGDGVTLKCWVRIELFSGRGVAVVDILAGEASEIEV